jgi:CYTH domain-containing protein
LGVEIERKFLVRDLTVVRGVSGTVMRQGYLCTVPERTVRVRRAGECGYLTIKGIGDQAPERRTGAAEPEAVSRPEFEYEIPAADADELLDKLALRPLIEKVRYRVPVAGLVWEVDVFSGENEGLAVAEVELPSADAAVTPPPWVGDEVTDDPRYFNANLVAHPYVTWRAG